MRIAVEWRNRTRFEQLSRITSSSIVFDRSTFWPSKLPPFKRLYITDLS
jgi:hypothetical protein